MKKYYDLTETGKHSSTVSTLKYMCIEAARSGVIVIVKFDSLMVERKND